MNETALLKRIQIRLSEYGARFFRNNTGTGWVGNAQSVVGKTVIIHNARPLRAGLCKGGGDLVGWNTITITEDMIGKRVAVFSTLEIKTAKGRVRPEQQQLIDVVKQAGGIAAVVRSEDEAIAALSSYEPTT